MLHPQPAERVEVIRKAARLLTTLQDAAAAAADLFDTPHTSADLRDLVFNLEVSAMPAIIELSMLIDVGNLIAPEEISEKFA